MPKTTRVAVGDWPRLSRFYGLGPFDLVRMPRWLTEYYAECIPALTAEEQLLAFTVADFPHAVERDRDRIRRQYRAEADIEVEAPRKLDVSSPAGQAMLAGMGIGIDFTPTPDSDPETPNA